ncbi:MAG: oxidoreductase NAD-like protein [Paenibacillaceae bacterium]|nr:oxidoreductase NAD-like protein [Paenibacillaceae bacterium]
MKVIVLAGSNRKAASSRNLAQAIVLQIREKGHEAVLVDLYGQPLPLFDPDQDYSGNPIVEELLAVFYLAQGIVLVSPEYHGTISGVLKNALDFLVYEHFDGKPVLSAASSGGVAAFGALNQLQSIVRNLHGINSPEWISVGSSERATDTNGEFVEPRVQSRIRQATDYFLKLAIQLGK